MSNIILRLKTFLQKMTKGEATMDETLIEEFGEACKAALRKHLGPRSGFTLRISQIGKPLCQQQYELLGSIGEEPEYHQPIKFLYGDISEAMLVTLLRASGVVIDDVQKEVVIDLDGTKVPGSIDGKINGKVVDFKSASPFAFDNKFKVGFNAVRENDSFGYVTQGYLYSEAENTKFDGWIVMNKVTGEIVHTAPPIADNAYKREAIQLAKDNIKALQNTKSVEDITRCFDPVVETFYGKPTGKKVLAMECQYCPFKQQCWGDKLEYTENTKSKAKDKPMKWYVK